MIFLERNSVRDDVSISRGITPACADMTERTGAGVNTMNKLILLQQLEAIHGEDFCSIHHAGGTIRGRCIDLYFDPEFIPLAFVQVKKIKPNFNDFEIFLV